MDSAENSRQMHVVTVFLNIEGIKLIIYKWFMNDIKVFSTHDIHMYAFQWIYFTNYDSLIDKLQTSEAQQRHPENTAVY